MAVVKTILMHKNAPGEAPAAAQFICGRLFREFGRFPEAQPGERLSSTGFGPEVMACAEHLYDHSYDITYALEYVFGSKENFYDVLGTKKRWPMSVFFGAWQDYELQERMDPKPNTLGVSEEDLDLAASLVAADEEEEEEAPPLEEDADEDDSGDDAGTEVSTSTTTTTTSTQTRTVGKDTHVGAFNYGRKLTWLYYVGMPLLEPQDVSGYDIDRVWTVDRIWSAHRFLMDVVTQQLRVDLKKEDWVSGQEIRKIGFAGHRVRLWLKDHKKEHKKKLYEEDVIKNNATKANFQRVFKEYQLKDDPTGKSYSPAAKICNNFFVQVKNQTHADVVNVDSLFDPLQTDERMVKWSKADGTSW